MPRRREDIRAYPNTQFVCFPTAIEQPDFYRDPKWENRRHEWEEQHRGEFYNTGEGGMEVWLLVPGNWARLNCCGEGHLSFSGPSIVGGGGQALRSQYPSHSNVSYDHDCHAGLLLASTGVAYMGAGPSEGYWYATLDDLLAAGRALYTMLKDGYGVDPVLATLLDT